MVHAAGDLHGEEAAQGRHDSAHGEDDEGRDEGRLLGLGPEAFPLDDQQRQDAGTDDERDHVRRVKEVQGERGDQQHHGDQPGAALTPEDAAGEHDHADAGDGRQRPGRLDHGDGQVLRDQMQVLPQRGRDRREQIDGPGHEQQDRSEPADAAHPNVVGRHLRGGRPRRAARPAGRQFRVDLGGLGPALDHGVGGDEPFTHGGQRQVGLGQEEPDMQLRSGLDLEGRLLAVVEECGWKTEAPPVLVHHLGGGARAGEEAGVEMGQLGHERPAHDHTRGPGLDGRPRRVERVDPVKLELGVGDGSRPGRAARPRGRQTLAAERPPNAARCDGDDESQDGEQRQGDHEGHDEA